MLDLQRELSEARLQAVGVRKENQALLKALQDSKQRQTDAESTVSELSHHQAHLEQVPELLAEISRLKGTLKQQEGKIIFWSRTKYIFKSYFNFMFYSMCNQSARVR